MVRTARVLVPLVLAIGLMGGCSTAPAGRESRDELIQRAAAALAEWSSDVTGLDEFARHSYGYAMFPAIAKGGLGLGAAYGRGVVWEQGEHIGYADLSHASVGLQAGGQAYRVLVVFDHKAALERFKRGRLDFSADTSAVLLEGGLSPLSDSSRESRSSRGRSEAPWGKRRWEASGSRSFSGTTANLESRLPRPPALDDLVGTL